MKERVLLNQSLHDLADPDLNDISNPIYVPITKKLTLFDLSKLLKENCNASSIAFIDENQQIVKIVTANVLIKTLLEAWQKTNAFYQTLLHLVNDTITVVDNQGKIISWNKKATQLYGINADEVLDKNILEFFAEEDLKILTAINTKKPTYRSYNQPKPGYHVLVNSAPVFIGNNLIGGIASEQDVTDVITLNQELSNAISYLHDLEHKINDHDALTPFQKIKGRGAKIQEIISLAKKVAKTDATVLLTGGSGVGKELFAEAIHKASPRSKQPLIALNCSAIPANLFESELFGYHRGAFTGASSTGKIGKLEAAQGGTLLLDEIGELQLELQAKLLRVLQEKRFTPIGSNKSIPLNIRFIAATNKNLESSISQGDFREDLYYRLNVISFHIPSLRERREDIPELIQLFLKEFSLAHNKPFPSLEPEVVVRLLHYHWPGNIRQLRNTIESLVILNDTGKISPAQLPPSIINFQFPDIENNDLGSFTNRVDSPAVKENFRFNKAIKALEITYGNKTAAAKLLGISRITLYNWLNKN